MSFYSLTLDVKWVINYKQDLPCFLLSFCGDVFKYLVSLYLQEKIDNLRDVKKEALLSAR